MRIATASFKKKCIILNVEKDKGKCWDNPDNDVPEIGRGEANNQEETSDESNQIQEEEIVDNFVVCGKTGTFTPGLTFPDYDSMMTAVDNWGQANFSPIITRSSGGRKHTFCCPHRQKKEKRPSFKGVRQRKKITIEYVDCPFLIDTKLNADGSYIVSRAETEHRGHEVSEEQFQRYQRSRWLTKLQKQSLALET